MMSLGLPEELAQAVKEFAAGHARSALAVRSAQISGQYRERAPSSGLIEARDDIAAYLLSRLPATYAAIATVFAELRERAPGFHPAQLLDAGAGPGTASWAAVEAWPELAEVSMVDRNAQFLAAARDLAARAGNSALAGAEVLGGSLTRVGRPDRRFDLVVAGYALTELPEHELPLAADELWEHCSGALAIIEPGRPRDYRRLMAVRDRLLAAGGQVAAPCPHQVACPLVAPDWCHFSVRLPRSRDHMRLKGASLSYEDEKFSYLVVARPELAVTPAGGRIVRRPERNKAAVTLGACVPAGLQRLAVPKRDAAAYRVARKLEWGDAIEPQADPWQDRRRALSK